MPRSPPPLRRRQLHACAGLARRSGPTQPPRPPPLRTRYTVRGTAPAREQPTLDAASPAAPTVTCKRTPILDDAEEPVVCPVPQLLPSLHDTAPTPPGAAQPRRALCLRPYEEVDCSAALPHAVHHHAPYAGNMHSLAGGIDVLEDEDERGDAAAPESAFPRRRTRSAGDPAATTPPSPSYRRVGEGREGVCRRTPRAPQPGRQRITLVEPLLTSRPLRRCAAQPPPPSDEAWHTSPSPEPPPPSPAAAALPHRCLAAAVLTHHARPLHPNAGAAAAGRRRLGWGHSWPPHGAAAGSPASCAASPSLSSAFDEAAGEDDGASFVCSSSPSTGSSAAGCTEASTCAPSSHGRARCAFRPELTPHASVAASGDSGAPVRRAPLAELRLCHRRRFLAPHHQRDAARLAWRGVPPLADSDCRAGLHSIVTAYYAAHGQRRENSPGAVPWCEHCGDGHGELTTLPVSRSIW